MNDSSAAACAGTVALLSHFRPGVLSIASMQHSPEQLAHLPEAVTVSDVQGEPFAWEPQASRAGQGQMCSSTVCSPVGREVWGAQDACCSAGCLRDSFWCLPCTCRTACLQGRLQCESECRRACCMQPAGVDASLCLALLHLLPLCPARPCLVAGHGCSVRCRRSMEQATCSA